MTPDIRTSIYAGRYERGEAKAAEVGAMLEGAGFKIDRWLSGTKK